MNKREVASMLRRDANIVGNAIGAVVCISFASLAMAAAAFDIAAMGY